MGGCPAAGGKGDNFCVPTVLSDMHPKKVTVLKGTGVELVTLFIIILAVTQHIYFTATVYVTELIFSVPRRLQIL